MRRSSSLFLLAACIATAPQSVSNAQPAPPNAVADRSTVTFRSTSRLVVETVVVKDKAGAPITGLTAADFLVTEDGVPQAIGFCEFQQLRNGPVSTSVQLPTTDIEPVTRNHIAPSIPGDTKYQNRRLLAIHLDLGSMPVPEQLRTFSGIRRFINTQMTAADLVSILSFNGGGVTVLADFTDDRERLTQTIDRIALAAGGGPADAPRGGDDGIADDSFGQDGGEFNLFNTDRHLAGLQTAVQMLGTLKEKKSLVYFASGLSLSGLENQAQMTATINAAIRANVSIFAVD